MRAPQGRSDGGQAGAEMLFFAVVLIFAMTLVVVNAWATIDAKFMVTAATREAARAYVEADVGEQETAARNAAHRVTDSYRANPERLGELKVSGVFARCEPIVATLSYTIPALRLPFASLTVGARTVSASHSEVVDPFRNRVPGDVNELCAQ